VADIALNPYLTDSHIWQDIRDTMIRFGKKSANHLVRAYNLMISVMRDAFEGDQRSSMTLQHALETARHEVVHRGILTAEEAFELAEYIKIDVNDAAELMMESSAEFYEWLALDIDTIERKVMEMFLIVADNTRNIIGKLQHGPVLLAESPVQRLKRITGPRMICARCGLGKSLTSYDGSCKACGHPHFIEASKDRS